MKPNILIVDDDKEITKELKAYLEPHGFSVITASNEQTMGSKFQNHRIDLVVLDIMLPGTDGVSLCKKIRTQSSIPVIMLSAAGSEPDRVVSLEVGADDFLAKPFSARELLARIKALLRRTAGEFAIERSHIAKSNLPKLYFDQWCFDRARRRLISNKNITISLSQREYEILLAFIERPHKILTRDQLLESTRGIEAHPFDRSIDVQVGRLRKKLEPDIKNPRIILTVRGGGYQFNSTVKTEHEQFYSI